MSVVLRTLFNLQEMLENVNKLIKGVSHEHKISITDRVKSGFTILSSVPCTRFAVLEYFASVYDDALFQFLSLGKLLQYCIEW